MEQNQPEEQSTPEQPPVVPSVPGAPGADSPGRAAGEPVKRRRSWKVVLLVVASVMGVLCSGTVGYGLWWYNQETKPDRSAPDVVVDNYLRALLVENNSIQASQYSCSDPQDLSAIEALRTDILDREERFGADFQITWGSLAESGTGSSRQVSVDIRLSAVVDGFPQSDIQSWRFAVLDQDEWRVCGSQMVS
ncbi:hypothetical protein ACIA8K_13990 [Catenuloplanes sp. NPDC051500]|uniref:hypothetical protein n=1 Tax=Catenuloplanes sp. NPDC051500 TaxID=3363959 RepID=UPI0037BB4D9E